MGEQENDARFDAAQAIASTVPIEFSKPVFSAASRQLAAAEKRGRQGGLESAALIADEYAQQNHKGCAQQRRRANRLGDDPFGHREMADIAAVELDACARESEAIASRIRALLEDSGK